ncbi:DUF4349 domain-containing protein [Chitinolyticbacter meiyuanensis]|uniref:DUF4349 domain-containing protein n=1 Tax=Chitinolyticbacter meiyuanensis TaxID=682798 RepID=UPI0011E5C2D8|nr:DUF4349 domain-containing protein [Chitinolyticbacter meiyuanensis]
MQPSRFLPILLVLSLALAACGKKEEGGGDFSSAESAAPAMAEAAPAAAVASSPADALTSRVLGSLPADRRFVITASVEARVKDTYRASTAIEDLAATEGGFVIRNDLTAEVSDTREFAQPDGTRLELVQYVTRARLIVRVPTARTQAFLRALAAQIDFLEARSYGAEDVQLDWLRQQLAARRSQEAQQQMGEVASAPGRTSQRIEAIDRQLQTKAARDEAMLAQALLDDKVTYSTVALTLHQPPQLRRTVLADFESALADQRPPFLASLGQSLKTGWRGLQTLVIALAVLWPLWLAVALVLGVVTWHLRRRRVTTQA